MADNAEVGDGGFELRLTFNAITCAVCGHVSTPQRSAAACPQCAAAYDSSALAAAQTAVRERRATFKGRLQRLQTAVARVPFDRLRFAPRGPEMDEREYRTRVLLPALDEVTKLGPEMRAAFAGMHGAPNDPKVIAAFGDVIEPLERMVDLVEKLREMRPPLEWRAAHRQLARTAARMVVGYTRFAMCLIAPDSHEAVACQQSGQDDFSAAGAMADRLREVVGGSGPKATVPVTDRGDLDLGAAAWRHFGETPRTIAEAAGLVKAALGGIPGTSTLTNDQLLLLFPATALGTSVVDTVLLETRARAVRAALDAADSSAPDWLADPRELLVRVSHGLERVRDLTRRWLYEMQRSTPREFLVPFVAHMYQEHVEGPLRDFGGLLVISGRAHRGEKNANYGVETARGVMAGDVATEFDRTGAVFENALRMINRNAAAHGGVEVLETGLRVTQREVRDGLLVNERSETLSDGEFLEDFAGLQECVLALQLAVLPWLWGHPDPNVRSAVAAVRPTAADEIATIEMLAGLNGLLGMTVEIAGGHVVARGRLMEGVDGSDPQRLPMLVPALAALTPAPLVVTVEFDQGPTITYTSAELPPRDAAAPEYIAMVGYVGARWKQAFADAYTPLDDLILLVKPQMAAVGNAFKLIVDGELAAGISGALACIKAVLAAVETGNIVGTHPYVAEARDILRAAGALFEELDGTVNPATRQSVLQQIATRGGAVMQRVADLDRRTAEKVTEARGNSGTSGS